MNILVVSTYPPMKCGIGRYAQLQVQSLRAEGHHVDVLSPPEGGGDFTAELVGGWRPLALLKVLWAYDEAYIHYTPSFFYVPLEAGNRLRTSCAFLLLTLLMGRRINFLIHETGYKIGEPVANGRRARLDRWIWRLARRVIFHSTRERDAFAEYYQMDVGTPLFEIWPQDKYIVRLCELDQPEARRALGLDPHSVVLLCIGFIQPHKGFERAIEALRQVDAPFMQLRIVGSVRLIWDKAHQYAQWLHDLADQDQRVEVLEGYLSDELFDTWIVAADYVIVPYHEIWTSAVAARAKVYERPLIAANTGGLAEQLTERSLLFSTDAELVKILRQIAADHPPAGERAATTEEASAARERGHAEATVPLPAESTAQLEIFDPAAESS